MRSCSLFLVMMLVSKVLIGQNLAFYGLLPALNLTTAIHKQWNVNVFTSTTIDAFDEKLNSIAYPATDLQFYFQPSLIYLYGPNLNFAGSYTYQRNFPFNENYVNEHRLWQQVVYAFPLWNGRTTHRFRFEERFIANRSNNTYPFSTRLRYQLGYNMPLKGRTIDRHEFYLNTYNECYFSLSGRRNALYSENWTYGGCGYDMGGKGRLEWGYLLQAAVRNKQKDIRFLHLAQIMWVATIDFKPKKKHAM